MDNSQALDNSLAIMSAMGSLVVIVLVVLAAFFASRWYARKMRGTAFGAGKIINIVDRAGLGQSASIAIVEIGGRYYLVGVGEKSVELLCELKDFIPPKADMSGSYNEPFGQLIKSLMDKVGRPKKNRDDGGAE